MSRIEIIKITEWPMRREFQYLSYLPKECIARIKRYRRDEDAYRSYFGELLRRKMIGSFLNCDCKDLQFYSNEFGKPFVKTSSKCYFNISHSGSYVVGIIDDDVVGIDIEKAELSEEDIPICYMHKEEIRKLTNFSDKCSLINYFYFLWTIKEAYLKATGKGLAKEMSSFWVDRNGKNEIRIEDEESSELQFKVYESISIEEDYVLSMVGNSPPAFYYTDDKKFLEDIGKHWL